MHYLIMTDIFGLCAATDKLSRRLNELGHHVTICDPYQGNYCALMDEVEAYQHFIRCSGHEAFYQTSLACVKKLKPEVIVGFSAGASAAWRLCSQDALSLTQVVCFYPSQIRHFSGLAPRYPCRLILPNDESSFDVTVMANTLSKKPQLDIIMSDYWHGFMNPKSTQYNKKAEMLGFTYMDNIALKR